MADSWHTDADRNHGSAGRGLHPAVLHRRLGLELADMKTITEMAREADVWVAGQEPYQTQLERFAALVRADEREACAKVCDEYTGQDYDTVSDILAAAIRARGNT